MATMMAENVDFSYPGADGADALRGVSVSIPEGGALGIIGPNGAGKSTLLRVMSGYLRPSSGAVSIDGRSVSSLPRGERAALIGVVPQNVFTPMPYTAWQVVEMGRAARLPRFSPLRREDRAAVGDAMREMDVFDLAERPFNALSGGERQRVVLASAIARKPAVLFLDEPTSQLDIGHAIRFVGLVLELRKRLGMTVVVVSHDVQLMSGFLPRMVVMRDGRVVADGPTEEVVTAEMIERVYGCRMETSRRKDGGVAILPEIPRP